MLDKKETFEQAMARVNQSMFRETGRTIIAEEHAKKVTYGKTQQFKTEKEMVETLTKEKKCLILQRRLNGNAAAVLNC